MNRILRPSLFSALVLSLFFIGPAQPTPVHAGVVVTIDFPPAGDHYLKVDELPPIAGWVVDVPIFLLIPIPLEYVIVGIQRDNDGAYWNGSGWQASPAWAPALAPLGLPGIGPWVQSRNLPSKNDLPDGGYTVTAKAKSDVEGTATAHFKVDRTPPAVDITTPADGSAITNLSGISGTVSDAGSGVNYVDVIIDKPNSGTAPGVGEIAHESLQTQIIDGNWSVIDPLPDLPEGTYLLKVFANDKLLNTSSKQNLFLVDRTPPLPPGISVPANDSTIPALSSISGTAADNPGGGGIGSVGVTLRRVRDNSYWNGSVWRTDSPSLVMPTTLNFLPRPPGFAPVLRWTCNFTLPAGNSLENGNYTLEVTAFDVLLHSTTATTAFKVDRVAPTITLTSPPNGGVYSGLTFPPIGGTATVSPGLGIAYVPLYLTMTYLNDQGREEQEEWNGSEWLYQQNFALPTTLTGNTWSYNGNLPSGANLPEGHYLVLPYVHDTGANSNFVASHVYIDRTPPPPPTITCPTNQFLGALSRIEGTAVDNPDGQGVDHVDLQLLKFSGGVFYWDGANWQSSETWLSSAFAGTNWIWTNALPANNDPQGRAGYQIWARAVDKAGNVGAFSQFNSIVDWTPPQVTITTPTNGQSLSVLSGFTGTARDDETGLERLEVNLNRSSDSRSWNGSRWTDMYSSVPVTVLADGTWKWDQGLPNGADLPPGGYFLNAVAYDLAGNSSTATLLIMVPIPNPQPTLASLDPNTGFVGDPGFTMYLIGSDFVQGASVRWNGTNLTTWFIDDQEVMVKIDAAAMASTGSAAITVVNPAPGGGSSSNLTFTILPRPIVANDNFADRISLGGYSVNVTGSNAGATVQNGEPNPVDRMTGGRSVWWSWVAPDSGLVTISTAGSTFDTLLAVYTGFSLPSLTRIASDHNSGPNYTSQLTFNSQAGTQYQIVVDGLEGSFGNITLNIQQAFGYERPTLTRLEPATVVAGSPAFVLTAFGDNFNSSAMIQWNSANQMAALVGPGQIAATIDSSLIATPGTVRVNIFIPDNGGGPGMTNLLGRYSDTLNFVITPGNPTPVLSRLDPSFAFSGGSAFTLSLYGTNFVTNAVVKWNGVAQPTSYITSNQLMMVVAPTLIATPGTVAITISQPGAPASNPLTFVIKPPNPVPALAGLDPTFVYAGSPGFTLTVGGANFVDAAVVRWNGSDRPTTFISFTQLTARVFDPDLTAAGKVSVTVSNPGPGGGISGSLDFTIRPPKPVPYLTSLSPSSAYTGGDAFLLTVNGSNFISGASVQWSDTVFAATTYVNSNRLMVIIPGDVIATPGLVPVKVVQDGVPSNPLNFQIKTPNAQPALSALQPNSAYAGGPGFTLTVIGSNFVKESVVRWNGSDRATVFASATLLTATIPASDITATGNVSIAVFNPAPGGGLSSSLDFSIKPPKPVPAILSLSPNSSLAGSEALVMTVNGSNFVSGATVQWNGVDQPTTFASGTKLLALISDSLMVSPGRFSITVIQDGVVSSPVTFTVGAPTPMPELTGLKPDSLVAGGGDFVLTVSGTNFVTNSVLRWNGADRVTTYQAPTQLVAAILSADIASAGTASVTVSNPAPGGGISGALQFTIQQGNPAPGLTRLEPSSVAAGSESFLLTALGTNFLTGSKVRWNGVDQSTTYSSSTRLLVIIPDSLIVSPGEISVTVWNPGPGGGLSSPMIFSITNSVQPPVLLKVIRWQTNRFDLRISGPPSRQIILYGSTNLTAWTPLGTIESGTGQADCADTNMLNFKSRFYRGELAR